MRAHLLLLVPLLFALAAPARADDVNLAVYRTGRPDPRVRQVPDEVQRGVFADPARSIEPLVAILVHSMTDDFQKVKVLHDWIAENITYDVPTFLSGVRAESTWDQTLRRRTAVCYGYAQLMERMCQAAGIPCKVIPGYGRGYAFGLGRAENVGDTNHAWNAVRIRDHWRLVDVTWDAGHVEGRNFERRYGTAYLFLEPRQFLYTHLPSDPQWQLLDPPVTAQQFSQLPYLPGRFFEQGLRLTTPLKRLESVGDAAQFRLDVPADVAVTAQLMDAAAPDGPKLDRRTLVRREGTRADVFATFPKPGRWNVEIMTKPRNDPGMFWQSATLEFESKAGSPWTFAETYSSPGGLDSALVSPVYVPLPAGRSLEFKIRVHGAEKVFLRLSGKQWLPMPRGGDDPEFYRLTATVPADGAMQIMARAPGGGDSYWTLVDFAAKGK